MTPIGHNPNESAYIGGRKHFTDVIKNTGPANMLIWRQPEEDFNDNSTLIVMPSEQAIFYRDGFVHQVFDQGRYVLSSENYPFISRIRNALSGGVSSFNCVVYFVRKNHTAEILWGTDSRIQIRDPVQDIFTSISGRGSYKAEVLDGIALVNKLAGHQMPLLSQEDLNQYFRNEFQQHIKETIAKAIMDDGREILGIVARLSEIAAMVKPLLAPILEEYGIGLRKFSISDLSIPEDDPTRLQLETAYSKKRVMAILGDKWGTQQGVDILLALVRNPAASGAANAMVGAQLGGSEFAPALGGIAQPILALILNEMKGEMKEKEPQKQSGRFVQNNNLCPSCKAPNPPDSKYCAKCGSPLTVAKLYCPSCGKEVPGDANYCSNCSAKLK